MSIDSDIINAAIDLANGHSMARELRLMQALAPALGTCPNQADHDLVWGDGEDVGVTSWERGREDGVIRCRICNAEPVAVDDGAAAAPGLLAAAPDMLAALEYVASEYDIEAVNAAIAKATEAAS